MEIISIAWNPRIKINQGSHSSYSEDICNSAEVGRHLASNPKSTVSKIDSYSDTIYDIHYTLYSRHYILRVFNPTEVLYVD